MSREFRQQVNEMIDDVVSDKRTTGTHTLIDAPTGEGVRLKFGIPEHYCELSNLNADISHPFNQAETTKGTPLSRDNEQARIRVNKSHLLDFLSGLEELSYCEYKYINLRVLPTAWVGGYDTDLEQLIQVSIDSYTEGDFGDISFRDANDCELTDYTDFTETPKGQEVRAIIKVDHSERDYLHYLYIYDSVVALISQVTGVDRTPHINSFYCPTDDLLFSYFEEESGISVIEIEDPEFRTKLFSQVV